MSIVHRPSDEALAAFAAGTLDEGLALVVAIHLEIDPVSRQRLRDLEAVQGALLEAAEPAAMSGTFGVLPLASRGIADSGRPAAAPERGLPRVLRPYVIGPWRKIGFRIAMRRVDVPGAEARVFMLRAAPGVSLPHHKHSGLEWTTILSGAFEHDHGRFATGDFDEAGEEHVHTPRVDPVEGCTCISAVTGEVLFQGWLGRILQPLVRL
ncbi:ChrR family anti-sigma-E factor [Enterovirga rhinocerotis]|uniref:ChrR-like anti-ECFsigma factor n=1 Tax=Enterovirga rhinocerotis TaxID=1339210 RepID=A0A4R7C6Q0_9HYPH|nr:ChrR family anti-sigma-E factor [Enterovirga rhinocerotis]TDR94270.1 ChrR-like anti-ECFsigma factor [Enterovirga rhinocerotis]